MNFVPNKNVIGLRRSNLGLLCSLSFICLGLLTAGVRASVNLIPAHWNAKEQADKVMAGLKTVTAPEVKGAHDAEMVIVDGYAYIVAELSDSRAGESASWPEIYVAMSVVDVETLKTQSIIHLARGEEKFANETLPVGACFVPRIIQRDTHTLRCYFASESPGQRQSQMWYRDFDLRTQAFVPTIHKVKIKTSSGTYDMQPQYLYADAQKGGFNKPAKDFGLYLFDSFKVFDGQTYVAVNNYPGRQNALAVLNKAMDTFEIIGHLNEPQNIGLCEAAINRLPDGTWLAIIRQDGGNRNYYFAESKDGRTWSKAVEMPHVQGGSSSKPTFDRIGGVYYLGWQDAATVNKANRSVFNVDVSLDGRTWVRKYRFETEKSFQYPTFREYQGAIYVLATQGDQSPSRKERIVFGKLEDVAR
ncbi:MAG TPA: sialidase family protein [Opitutaceae bacterium]|nr:sialidase family protein [Opitutaceae bacterium]